jgi:bifunctional non-homologous end joining protein LigD
MLATLVDKPPEGRDWVFEEKYDGVRMLSYKEGPQVSLVSRNDIDRSDRYPEIALAIKNLKPDSLVLDGEIVMFDAKGVSRFQLLQQGKGRAEYAIFDCLFHDGKDLRREPLSVRRQLVESVVRSEGLLRVSQRLTDNGIKAFRIAAKRGLEGIVAKNLASRYESRRSKAWLKVKVHREQELVIGGFTRPKGSRLDFGALLLGVYDKKGLRFVGKVGTGFNEETLRTLFRKFQPRIQSRSPFVDGAKERDVTFLKPEFVAQIAFTEWTKDGKLRHPVYLGLRDDKKASEVRREGK